MKCNYLLIGCISISYDSSNKSGEVGYWIAEKYWNNGYASEALSSILEKAFKEDGYNKVYGFHYRKNVASGKVMIKNGMKKDGVVRDYIYKDKSYFDVFMHSILKKEF